MKFEEALVAMREGKKLRRAEWLKDEGHEHDYINIQNGLFSSYDGRSKQSVSPFSMSVSFLMRDDWEIVE